MLLVLLVLTMMATIKMILLMDSSLMKATTNHVNMNPMIGSESVV